jgi:hypothetical protein
MRNAYARWFWKMPIGGILVAVGLIVSRARRSEDGSRSLASRSLASTAMVAGLVVLMSAIMDWRQYQANRSVYQAEE